MKKFIFNVILVFTCTTSFSQTLGGTIVKGTKKIERVETTLDTVAINAETGNDARSATITGQPTGDSSEVGITDGQLSVSLTGAATYSIPISVPPGINGVVPQISLTYNSQAGNGIAGFGWNISGLSSIKKVPITKYHDENSWNSSFLSYTFALDGQRLIRTSANNVSPSVWVTENFSNLKITWSDNIFLVEYPDGSIANYSTVSSSEWAITYWQNPQGVRINYFYTLSNNVLYVSSITYGSTYQSTGINTINFIYNTNPSLRPEQAYVFGVSQIRNKILKQIYITGVGTVGYKNYHLEYDTAPNSLNSLNYQRLTKITEKSGDNLVALNPTLFSYNNTSETIFYSNTTTTLPSFNGAEIRNTATVAGDFDGDGKMDVVLYPIFGADTNKWFSVLTKMDGSSPNIGATIPTLPTAFVNIFATTFKTYTNKLSSINGITTIRQVGAVNNYEFRNYYYEAGAVYTQNVITIQLPGTGGYTFYDGDFNGDGLTDVLAKSNNSYDSFYINLDMSATTNSLALSGGFNPSTISFISKTGDYNGNGKTDLYIFLEGRVAVYEVILNLNLSYLNNIASIFNDSDITLASNKTILLGDFNGDGKTDFLVSPESGSGISNWIKYTATVNSYPSYFVRTIENYPSLLYGNPNENYSYNTLFTTDFDNDGKTDILKLTGYKNTSQSYGNVTVRCYPNKNGAFSGLSGGFYTATSGDQTEITKWALPIFYNSKHTNRKLEIGFILGNKIHYFLSSKDFNKDKLLRTITTGNGVKETITYKPLIEESVNNSTSPNVYFPEGNYIEDYPNTDIKQSSTFQVVSKLERESKDADSYRKQFYTYYGAVANLEGLGFLGFRATMRTNWHTGVAPFYLISTVSRNDIGLRGANIQNFTTGVYQNANSTLSSFANYISKEDITYNDYDIAQARLQALQPNKVFKLKVIDSEKYDGLNKTSQETLATGFDIYNNPAQVTVNTKKLSVIEKTSVINLTYDNQVTSGTYIVGRPLSKAVTSTIYPTLADQDIFKENEWYTYTDNLLSKIRRRGNANPKSMYEINHYDIFGNLTQKIITDDSTLNKPSQSVASKDVSTNPIGTDVPTGPPAPRVLDYEYNPAAPYYGRFLTKSYNVEHLPTTYDYNCSVGTLSSITNPYGFTTSFLYDKWFKQTQVTDFLGKSKFTTYARVVEKSKITTTSSTGGDASTEVLYDDLFRNIRTGVVNLNGTWTYQSNLYNLHDRVYKTSEPYFGTTPSLWNETKYDPYGRVSQTIDATLKTTTISYGNLTMTVDDTQKQTVLVKNSMGNLISTSDIPGGTITNKYFANGNLKSSTYDNGGTTVFEQDQWGRRKKMTDPSAGVFSYLYNIYGETVKEINPNGTIDYTLDNFGNIIKKVVAGNNGDYTKTNYTFDDTTRLLTSSSFEDVTAGSTTNYVYGYDTSKRLTSIDESSPLAHFYNEVQFDTFGRPLNIRYTATNPSNTGQNSDKWINYTYQNGYKYQIKDGFNGVGTTLWQTNTVNDRGQILTAQLGNGITLTNTINSYGDPTKIKHDKTVTNIMTLNTTFNAAKSRLLTRDSNVFGTGASLWSEDFTSLYDYNDRLTGYKAAEGTSYVTQSYDTNGNINTNNIGTYEYNVTTGKPFQTAAITPASPAMLTYYADREQTILYNTIKKPIRITGNNQEIIDFDYNFAESRSTMYYGNSDANKLARPFIKSYSADGSMEIRRNTTNGTIEFITYIDGDAYSAPVLLKTDGTVSTLQNYLYLHRDYQGSIVAITDGTGAVKEKRLFDAWGSLIKYWNSTGLATVPTTEGVMLIDRGYTGHEHLLGVGLINMNGRLYDPRLHRFLSPDNNLQDPLNTQNYNRYAYVLNNPLNYTDTSGEDCDECPNNGWTFTYENNYNPYENYESNDGENFGNWVKQNNDSFSNWFNNNANSLADNINDFVDWLTGAESPPSVPSTVYNQNAPSQLGVFDTRSNSLQTSYNTGDIHMPTQHHFMGVNMTELSEGNIIKQALYSTANSVNLVAQYIMGRSVGDSSMRNLNGTPTRTNEAALSIGTLPLLISGGGAVESGLATTSNGFLFGSIGFKTPINLKVGLYTSESTLKYGTFKWSTIAPKVLANFNFFGRKFLHITSEFQPTLGSWSTQTIEKGTKIRVGLVGPQGGNGIWTWIQFYVDKGAKYIKP